MVSLAFAKSIVRTLIRKKTPIIFNDLTRMEPISRSFGFDRGRPIDRHYIEAYLKENAGAIAGDCIEVGEASYLRQFGTGVISRNILAAVGATIRPEPDIAQTYVADLTKPATLPKSSFDCFVCTNTLPFIYDVKGAIEGAQTLLRPKGVFLGTVCGIAQISRYDMDRWGDYWRFTTASLERLLSERFSNVSVKAYGNLISAQMLLQGAAVEDLKDVALLDRADPDYEVIIGFRASNS